MTSNEIENCPGCNEYQHATGLHECFNPFDGKYYLCYHCGFDSRTDAIK